MSAFTLRHLTLVGEGVPTASVSFSDALTVIHGSSDTGKSFVFKAVDFMLGAKTPKHVREMDPYSHALLGLKLADDSVVTLMRSLSGGKFLLYRGDIRERPAQMPDSTLSPTHNPKSDSNLSMYLLEQLNLAGKQLRKNNSNVNVSLSFRDLAKLCLVDETVMLSDVSPVETGQFTTRTKERSALKLLLTGEDDSATAVEAAPTEKRITQAQVGVLDNLITRISSRFDGAVDPVPLRLQLARLNESIAEVGRSIESAAAQYDEVVEARRASTQVRSRLTARLSDVDSLVGRFGLLRAQYATDLQRLGLVEEAGNLLSYFEPGPCPFCGADVEHQKSGSHLHEETVALEEAIVAERDRTTTLLNDLQVTLTDLALEQSSLSGDILDLRTNLASLDSEMRALAQDLQPHRDELASLVAERSSVEGILSRIEQLREVEAFRATVDVDRGSPKAAPAGLDPHALSEFIEVVKSLLSKWNVIERNEPVAFDQVTFDLVVGSKPRAERGKGMRAIIHAALTLGLAQFCIDQDLPHPGFVILDSPLVTYEGPRGEYISENEDLSMDVADAFYRYLHHESAAQVVIMENTTPPELRGGDTVIYEFTRNRSSGRFGFFPVMEPA